MSYSYIKKQYYTLRREWKEYKQEYNNIKIQFDEIGKQFTINVIKFCADNDLGDPFTETEVESQNVGRINSTSSSFKKIFRNIVTSTHPDKAEQTENSKQIYTAATIKVNVSELTTAELNLLQSNIDELKDKIQKIKNSYAWVWFYSNPSKRNRIFYDFIESVNKK